MKPSDKILTYEQARELKWFCKNVTGVRLDMYSAMEEVRDFDARIERLEETCGLIEKFIREWEEGAK